MNKRWDTTNSKDKLASSLRRGAVVSGVAAAVAAASLGGVPNADATCIGISGFNIGDGCNSTLGNFALVLGTGTATTAGFLNAAIAVGNNVNAIAGGGTLDSLNLALNFGNANDGASSTVTAGRSAGSLLPSNFNLAANLGGNAGLSGVSGQDPIDMDIFAGDGFLNVALNVIGNRNTVRANDGSLNFAINAGGPFSFPNGSDNEVTATGGLSAALNSQTFLGEPCSVSQCGNTVTANGPLSLAVAAGVVRKLVEAGNFDITFANSFNSDDFEDNPNLDPVNILSASGAQGNTLRQNSTGGNTNVLAAGGTRKNSVRPSLNAASHRAETTSADGPARKSVSDSIKKGAKKASDSASRASSGPAKNAKAGADGTDRDNR